MAWQTPDSEAIGGGFVTPDSEAIKPQGAIESGLRGAVRNFPLAQQAVAAASPVLGDIGFTEHKNYGEELKHLTQAAEEGKAQNPWAYGAGAVAGSLAPLAIPIVGEGLTAAPIAGNAALGATQALSDINLAKDPNEAVKQGLMGGAIGGATAGVMGKVFPKGVKAPVSAEAPKVAAPAVEDAVLPVAQAVKGANTPKAPGVVPNKLGGLAVPDRKVASDFVPSADRIYASNLAQGMGGTPRQLMKVFGKKDPVQTMVGIGKWLETAGEGGKPLNTLIDRPGELLEKVSNLHDSSGKVIGNLIDEMGPVVEVDNAAMLAELKEMFLSTADSGTRSRINNIIKNVKINMKNGIDDFKILQNAKKMAGEQIAKDPEMGHVYGTLADRASSLVEEYGNSIKDPRAAASYAKAKLDYYNSSRILPILRYAEAKDITGGPGGHHTLRGLLASIYNMSMEAIGVPEAGQLVKNAQMKLAPISRDVVQAGEKAREAVAPVLAPAAKAAGRVPFSQAAQTELTDYLESQYNRPKKNQ